MKQLLKVRNLFFSLLRLSDMSLQAQSDEPTISTDMPVNNKPSLSLAAFMKFEEVPLSL